MIWISCTLSRLERVFFYLDGFISLTDLSQQTEEGSHPGHDRRLERPQRDSQQARARWPVCAPQAEALQ